MKQSKQDRYTSSLVGRRREIGCRDKRDLQSKQSLAFIQNLGYALTTLGIPAPKII